MASTFFKLIISTKLVYLLSMTLDLSGKHLLHCQGKTNSFFMPTIGQQTIRMQMCIKKCFNLLPMISSYFELRIPILISMVGKTEQGYTLYICS